MIGSCGLGGAGGVLRVLPRQRGSGRNTVSDDEEVDSGASSEQSISGLCEDFTANDLTFGRAVTTADCETERS